MSGMHADGSTLKALGPEQLILDNGLTLQMAKADDGPKALQIFQDNEHHYSAHVDYAAGYKLEVAVANFKRAQEGIDNGKLVEYWIVRDGETIGDAGFDLRDDGSAKLGYRLVETAQKHGYATQVSRFLLRLAFANGVTSVELDIKPANESSIKVAERIGATFDRKEKQEHNGTTSLYHIWKVTPDV